MKIIAKPVETTIEVWDHNKECYVRKPAYKTHGYYEDELVVFNLENATTPPSLEKITQLENKYNDPTWRAHNSIREVLPRLCRLT